MCETMTPKQLALEIHRREMALAVLHRELQQPSKPAGTVPDTPTGERVRQMLKERMAGLAERAR